MQGMCLQVENVANEEIPQIYTICGRGSRSSLRVLRPGLAVTEMAVSPLPGNPTAVWTTKRNNTSEFDNYIIVSFTNATLVSKTIPACNASVYRQVMALLLLKSWLHSAMT